MIGIIDYGMGNLGSVFNAIASLGYSPKLIREPDQLDSCDHVVLPGVGSYGAAMENLTDMGFVEPIKAHVRQHRPLLGICLGMQLLSSKGTEHGVAAGLDIIPGEVSKLETERGLRLPHVGWNTVEAVGKHPVLAGVRENVDFYFVHSYHFRAKVPTDVLAVTSYGHCFASVVGAGSAIGVQFHPEKSQENGLRILENFCRWDGTC